MPQAFLPKPETEIGTVLAAWVRHGALQGSASADNRFGELAREADAVPSVLQVPAERDMPNK